MVFEFLNYTIHTGVDGLVYSCAKVNGRKMFCEVYITDALMKEPEGKRREVIEWLTRKVAEDLLEQTTEPPKQKGFQNE